MNKRLFRYLISTLLVLMISVSAQAAKKLKMSVIAPGTSPYLMMTTMATMVNQAQDDVELKVDATGAATKHMIELAQGKIDLCMTSPSVYRFMKNQAAMYKKLKNAPKLAENLRLMYWFPLGQYHLVTYASSNIRSFDDIRGKRVFLGPPGGGAWATSRQWLEAAGGIKVHDDYENVKASWSSAFQGFQDRQFDVFITSGIAPYPQVEQLALTSKLYIVGLTKEGYYGNDKAVKMTTVPGRNVGVIKKGVYGKNVLNDFDVYTTAATVGVTVNRSMDNATAYMITKHFWEGAKVSIKTHPWLGSVTMEYAIQNGGMQLHPGAARYYREQGMQIPEGSKP